MRWTLSLTDVSGKPTRIVLGRPAEASTSTSTGSASMPTRANVLSLTSIAARSRVHGAGYGGSVPGPRRRAATFEIGGPRGARRQRRLGDADPAVPHDRAARELQRRQRDVVIDD